MEIEHELSTVFAFCLPCVCLQMSEEIDSLDTYPTIAFWGYNNVLFASGYLFLIIFSVGLF